MIQLLLTAGTVFRFSFSSPPLRKCSSFPETVANLHHLLTCQSWWFWARNQAQQFSSAPQYGNSSLHFQHLTLCLKKSSAQSYQLFGRQQGAPDLTAYSAVSHIHPSQRSGGAWRSQRGHGVWLSLCEGLCFAEQVLCFLTSASPGSSGLLTTKSPATENSLCLKWTFFLFPIYVKNSETMSSPISFILTV